MPHKGQIDEFRFTPAWWELWTVRDLKTGCLLWTGSACKLGYGRTWFQGRSGRPIHRVAYECFYGPFDKSLKVCHVCDVPNCIDPYHLFLGTQKENLRDMFAKRRARPRGRVPGEQGKQVLALFASNPQMTQGEIARQLNTSKQRVGQILRDAGIWFGKRRLASPTLASAEVASENSNAGVITRDLIHLIGPESPPKADTESWRQVNGLPPVQPTQAVVLWKRPLEWTGNQQPASNLSRSWPDAADSQPCRIGGEPEVSR